MSGLLTTDIRHSLNVSDGDSKLPVAREVYERAKLILDPGMLTEGGSEMEVLGTLLDER